jgi:hypothetical protein
MNVTSRYELGKYGCALVAASMAMLGSISDAHAEGVVRRIEEPGSQTITPILTRGDTEFGGHGPRIDSSARIYVGNGQLRVKICMTAKETQEDWTTVSECSDRVLYDGNAEGTPVIGIAPNQDISSEYQMVDNDEEVYVTESKDDRELVKSFEIMGDTQGEDGGVSTYTTFRFNPINILIGQ